MNLLLNILSDVTAFGLLIWFLAPPSEAAQRRKLVNSILVEPASIIKVWLEGPNEQQQTRMYMLSRDDKCKCIAINQEVFRVHAKLATAGIVVLRA
jgi:hypothetical protein